MTGETRWCRTCRRRQPVTETFPEAFYAPEGEYHYAVTMLACEHWLQSAPVLGGPAPGAPYAGTEAAPTVAAARSERAAGWGVVDYDDPWA